jgi:hypothetical protein
MQKLLAFQNEDVSANCSGLDESIWKNIGPEYKMIGLRGPDAKMPDSDLDLRRISHRERSSRRDWLAGPGATQCLLDAEVAVQSLTSGAVMSARKRNI